MPNCFTLTRKGENAPASLQTIDDLMRVAFGEEPDPKRWLWGWYDVVGFGLALGRDWTQLREQYAEDPAESERTNTFHRQMLTVIDWLDEHYTTDAWAERGRR